MFLAKARTLCKFTVSFSRPLPFYVKKQVFLAQGVGFFTFLSL
jgi:hypothetical protein